MIRPTSFLILALVASSPSFAGTIFTEDFAGPVATDLNGTVPNETTAGATWVASPNFKSDGSFSGTAGSATLSFAPVDGFIYTLEASMSGIAGDSNWVALGFANGQSTAGTAGNRFVNGNSPEGRAWMLVRGDNSANPNVSHTLGSVDPGPWTGLLANANGGDLDLRIILDTTGGAGAWTVTWFAKRPADASYLEVRSGYTLLSQDINSAGFAVSNSSISGIIESFSLVSHDASSPPGLIHHWKLDGDANDSAGSANGTIEGGAVFVPGKLGEAVSLDGLDDYISTTTAGEIIIPAANYTLMAWARWDAGNGSRGYLAGGQNAGANGEVLTMGKSTDGSDRILFLNLLPNDGQGNSSVESPDGALSTEVWHHIAYTVDGINGTSLYLDGLLVGTNPTRTSHTASTSVFNIGNNPQVGSPNPFDGLIDDVAVFSGVLTPAQIRHARDAGAQNFDEDFTPPSLASKEPDLIAGVYPGAQLIATFDEEIALVAGGTITVVDTSDGSSTQVINLSDASQASLSGRVLTITPAANLEAGTTYEVVIASDTIEDLAISPNGFPGTDPGEWTFTTAPEDLSAPMITGKAPVDGAPEVSRATMITATFDDSLIVGTGNIVIRDLVDGSSTRTIDVTDGSLVTVSGNILTIDPGAPLLADRDYAVQMESSVVKNFSDIAFPGIPETDVITWNFRTRASSPNVIFILSDDQAWFDYSFMRRPGVEKAAIDLDPGIPQVAKTPAIDRLADEGLAFVHGYCNPVCRPSLASIITGTHAHQHWVTGNDLVNSSGTRINDTTVEARMQVLNPLPRTLASQLGYTCFQTGKWWEGHPSNGGFTHSDTANSTAGGTAPSQWTGGTPSYVRARHGDWGLMTGRVDYVNDIQNPPHPIPYANTVQTVTDFITEQVTSEQPFMVWYAPFLPHTPHDPPSGLLAQYTALGLNNADATYYANIERFDGGVGAILEHLDNQEISDETIIVMICDNGRQYDLSTLGKLTPYETGVRTPVIIRWPDKIKAGGEIEPQVIRTPVDLTDLVPTVQAALGIPTFPEMTGINLLDPAAVLARDTVCGADYDVEIRDLDNPWDALESRFAVKDGWKLILFTNGSKELYQLYDRSTGMPVDPHETNNVVASHPGIVTDLTSAIVNWYAVEANGSPYDYNAWISDPAFGIDPANRDFSLDLDNDGLPNGIEAWFGTHPEKWDAGFSAPMAVGAISTFSHPQNPSLPSGLSASYHWSPNLIDWYRSDGVDGPGDGAALSISKETSVSTTSLTATASESFNRLFFRIKVTEN